MEREERDHLETANNIREKQVGKETPQLKPGNLHVLVRKTQQKKKKEKIGKGEKKKGIFFFFSSAQPARAAINPPERFFQQASRPPDPPGRFLKFFFPENFSVIRTVSARAALNPPRRFFQRAIPSVLLRQSRPFSPGQFFQRARPTQFTLQLPVSNSET